MQSRLFQTVCLSIGAIAGWTAVGLQFYLIVLNRVTSIPETIIRFFSFFTILTNILVAFYFTVLLVGGYGKVRQFFSRTSVVTAIAVYITIVGLVYQFLLRQLWDPMGLQRIADELLHSVIPFYFVVYWWTFLDRNNLTWKQIPAWLIYPLCYLLFILFRGELSGFYPYPFVDVAETDYGTVLRNSVVLLLVFVLFSSLFVWLGRMKSFQKSS